MKLGVLVGDKGNWTFFDDIYSDLRDHYDVEVHHLRTFKTPILYGRLNRWTYLNDIRAILRRNDLCLFEWATDLLVTASQMEKFCPIVTRLHSYEIYAWAPSVNWDQVDRVILVSNEMRRKFAELYPDHSWKARVVNNGVSLTKFRPPGGRTFGMNLGMLASIHPAKRIYEIIMMQHSLKELGHSPILHVAGKRLHGGYVDEYYTAMLSLVAKLDLNGSFLYHGQVADAHRWLRGIDIFISNSYWEGQQVALLEAMASGCYCLSHFWDGAEEILPAENLYVTETELQRKILEYSELPEREKGQRQAEMRTIASEKFDIERTKREIRSIIDEVAASTVL
ncbi:MAG: glycosyltransferase family 4 protein [Anaerolineales bacterium]